jgi:hypothetical protein
MFRRCGSRDELDSRGGALTSMSPWGLIQFFLTVL